MVEIENSISASVRKWITYQTDKSFEQTRCICFADDGVFVMYDVTIATSYLKLSL